MTEPLGTLLLYVPKAKHSFAASRSARLVIMVSGPVLICLITGGNYSFDNSVNVHGLSTDVLLLHAQDANRPALDSLPFQHTAGNSILPLVGM
jgi:hypothetical protein